MPKKNRKQDRAAKLFEKAEIESAEANVEATSSVNTLNEASDPDQIIQEENSKTAQSDERRSSTTTDSGLADVSAASIPASYEEETSTDGLLDDVRQSLIEDETLKEDKKSKKWWRRVAKGLQKDKDIEPVETPIGDENALTPVNMQIDLTEEKEETNSEVDEIDELILMLESEADEISATASELVESPSEPEVEVDLEELKKQAFRPRSKGEDQEDATEVRSVALEDGEEVFVEVESKPQNPLEERLTAFENALRPYQRYIYIAFTVLGVLLAVIASAILFNIYRQSRPAAPTVVSNLPFPTSISLPGGLNFILGKGSLANGQWNPQGPEWLQGTEICRWVAIPWSTQLEAVIRTLNADDPIELTMSNNDRLTYKVYSIQQLTNPEMQDLPSDSPCLLLVLAKADTETRWVLTALP